MNERMFEPVIVFHASNEVWKIIFTPLSQNMPNELLFSLPDRTNRRIKCRPNIIRTDDPPHFKTISCAPQTFVYCFTCQSKAEYTTTVHDQIVQYYQKYEKKFNNIVPVLIYDLSQSKGIFGGGTSSIETAIKVNYPNLHVLTIEKNLTISPANAHHFWETIMNHANQSMSTRIKILTDLLNTAQNKHSIETVRHYLRLIYIYSSLTLYELQDTTTKKAILEIEKRPQFFKEFIKTDEIQKPVDAFDYSKYQESSLTRELPSEYAMRQAFLRLKIHSFSVYKGESATVEYAWNFCRYLVGNIEKIAQAEDASREQISAWLVQFLYEMTRVCMKKNAVVKPFFPNVLKTYLSELEKFKGISDNSGLSSFPIVVISRDQNAFLAERGKARKCLFDSYLKLNLRRSALFMVSQLSDDEISGIDFQLLISTPIRGFTQFAPRITLDHLSNLSAETRVRLAFRILCDSSSCNGSRSISVNQEYANLGASILSDVFGSDKEVPKLGPLTLHLPIRLRTNLPVVMKRIRRSTLSPNLGTTRRLSGSSTTRRGSTCGRRESDGSFVSDTDNDTDEFTGFIVNQDVEVEFEALCDFGEKTSFLVNDLKVGFSDQSRNITYFKGSKVTIGNNLRFKVKGQFKRPNPVTPVSIVFVNCLNVSLPNSTQVIHVKKSLPPFKFSIKLPDLLLPGLPQRATLNIDVISPLKTLDIQIGGLSHSAEVLTLQPHNQSHKMVEGENAEKRKASLLGEGLSFSDIPVGRHQLNFQIHASKSGSMKVQVSSENHRVKKSTNFTVSDFLEFSIVYRKITKTAQLVVSSKQPCNITLTNVDFYDENDDNNRLICIPFGLPAKIQQVKTSILFLLDEKPDAADVWLQQDGLASFNLSLKVVQMDEEMLNVKEPQIQIPTTSIVPDNFEFIKY